MDWSWPPASAFVLRVISLVGATVIIAIGASVAKRTIQVAHVAKKERDMATWVGMLGGFIVAALIVGVGYRLFSSGYFIGYN